MKKIREYIPYVLLAVLLMPVACQTSDIPAYSEPDKVNIDYTKMGLQKDTVDVTYGFSTDQSRTINLELLMMGYATGQNREVKISVAGNTELVGKVLVIPEKIEMPANEVRTTIPCVIERKTDLIGKGCEFQLKIEDSKDLGSGIKNTLVIRVTDDVPDVWQGDENWWGNYVVDYFGECSKTKYRFVYSVLGVWDFSAYKMSGFYQMGDPNKFKPANRLLKQELAKLEEPLVDPEKGPVTFPDL